MSESSGIGPEMDALRDELLRALEERGAAVADAARQMTRVGYSTLQAWLKSSYKGDNGRIATEVRRWLSMLAVAAERRAVAPSRTQFVETPTALAFIAVLRHAQVMPDVVTITGGPGVGKTLAAEEYARQHPNVWIFTARPTVATPSAVLDRLCHVTGVREPTVSRRNWAIVSRVTGTRGLLIIDEANHLTTAALDELRSIHDEATIGLALMGNEQVYARLDGGGRQAEFAQLFSRVGLRLRRPKPLPGDVAALLDAAGIAGEPERKLLRTIAAKPGALRGATKCLTIAEMLAAEDGVPVAASHIGAAWARLTDSAPVAELVQ